MSTYKINAANSNGQCYMYDIYSYVVRYCATCVYLCTQILYIYVVVLNYMSWSCCSGSSAWKRTLRLSERTSTSTIPRNAGDYSHPELTVTVSASLSAHIGGQASM
jgi:hypothetical protein